MRAVAIYANGDVAEIDGELRSIQETLAGYLEIAPTPGAPFVMFVNEHGKLEGLPYNERANMLANQYRTWDDPLVGNAVLVGPPDAAGEETEYTLAEFLKIEGSHVPDLR